MNVELKILDKRFYLGEEVDSTNPSHEERFNIEPNELPAYATMGSAGMDLKVTTDVYLFPNCTYLAGTGVAIHINSGSRNTGWHDVAGIILPRSGLGHKVGIILGNGTGLIDSDYQGEIKVSLWNRSETMVELKAGDRVAQLVFIPIMKPGLRVVDVFSNSTERGGGGFGSTNK